MYLAYNNSWLAKGDHALAWYVPSALPAYTLRLLYKPGARPGAISSSMSFTQVSAEPNIWDMTYLTSNWWNPFDQARSYGALDLLAVLDGNTTGVTDMQDLFFATPNLFYVAWFDTSNVTDMGDMFRGCRYLKEVPLYDTHNVTDMFEMFYECESLVTVPLFDTSNVSADPLNPGDMAHMFYHCTSLTSVPLFDTHNVTGMDSMFSGCINLTQVPLFDTSSVKSFIAMFNNCRSLRSIPLLDTSSCLWMQNMCRDCINVETGAYNLYAQVSTQSRVPEYHDDAFTNCGSNTVSGAAELALIPSSWGGTAP